MLERSVLILCLCVGVLISISSGFFLGHKFPFKQIVKPSLKPHSNIHSTSLTQILIRNGHFHHLYMSTVVESTTCNDNIPTPMDLPSHPELKTGYLKNGLKYIILPNRVPGGRFEAHLEILSGSAFELDRQQGMAHLLEHVVYMGSPKRQLISGTGSRTNAYTDFHHTVFFAACPTYTPDQFWKKPMLPMAFDALLDVMTVKVDDDRMEKERAAVLSEASMVNKMEYRVECQVLGALHSENRISRRFPIGKEKLIKEWTKEEVQFYHSTHYRPDNAILYVVGDIDTWETEKLIELKFGFLDSKIESEKMLQDTREFPSKTMHMVNPHFPPVVHDWSCDKKTAESMTNLPKEMNYFDDSKLFSDMNSINRDGFVFPAPVLYKHELLQSFSFHLFAKRPIESITSLNTLRRDIIRRMTLSALQIRFNVEQRQEPLFTFVDFNQLNWPREGCAVCSLDMTTEISQWKQAIKVSITEIRRLGLFGLTNGEMERYKSAILSEAEQFAAQSGQMSNEDVLQEVMEAESCGHILMDPIQRLEITRRLLKEINLDDIMSVAQSLCEHLSHIRVEDGVRPAAVIACCPKLDRNGEEFQVEEEEIKNVIFEALNIPLEPLKEIGVPKTLISTEELNTKVAVENPVWVNNDSGPKILPGVGLGKSIAKYSIVALEWNKRAVSAGIEQLKLSNGIRVNLIAVGGEPQRASVRLYVPGGRMWEDPKTPGSILLGSRTIQEGGAFADKTREEVELFCIDHMVMVDIQAVNDALIFDFQSVTTLGPGGMVTGLEAVMQVAHIILTDFLYEADAFDRAKQAFHEQYDSVVKGLETACQEAILLSLTGNDGRFGAPNHDQIDELDIITCKQAIVSQLCPDLIEVSLAGDTAPEMLRELALKYLGTVPKRKNIDRKLGTQRNNMDVSTFIRGFNEPLNIYLCDSEPRAVGYLAGPCPNRWGIFADGTTVGEKIGLLSNCEEGSKNDVRRRHPLFGHVLLNILSEIINRRLFSVVREERRLTYDASFQLKGSDSIDGAWYLVSVTSSPTQVQAAIEACRDAIHSLSGPFGIMGDSVQAAKRTLINRFRTDMITNKFWVETLSGTQLESLPNKNLGAVVDYEKVLSGITVKDIQYLVQALNLHEDNMNACIGISAPQN